MKHIRPWQFVFTFLVFASTAVGFWLVANPASAALPGTKWGTQIELGTVGNSTVIKAMDETHWCLIFQPKNGNTPAIWCESVATGLP